MKGILMSAVRALGDLGFATSVGCYQPDLAMHLPTSKPFGLPEQSFYLYGGWQTESGARHIIERK
ncbi:MAG: hypothetical protein QOD39_4539, partial [Mycobacterium sp.]|nr:hypothetical protein [Mycobacterium sp.]